MGDLQSSRGDAQSTGEIEDRRLIAELLQNWVVWRDAGDWERFRAVRHPDGRMMATPPGPRVPATNLLPSARKAGPRASSILKTS